MHNALNWFEIPVTNLDRATRFYERVLDTELKREVFAGNPMAVFAAPPPAVGGALVVMPHRKPSADGALVYLDASGKLDAALARTAEAGGEVLLARTDIGEPGFIAVVRDTEGNHVGLHAPRG